MSSHSWCFIYIQLLCIINSQWTQIWYDSMDQNNGEWNTHTPGESEVIFGHVSENNNCKNCTRIKAVRIENDENCWIGRSTDISAYSSIKLQFDLALSGLEEEENDRCRVYYAYDETNKQQIAEYDADGISLETHEAYHIPNQTINVPLSPSSQTLWIYFETDPGVSGGADNCLVDNVYLYGIFKPTPSPTSSPFKPSKATTPFPSNSPTKDPSNSPTKYPLASASFVTDITSGTSMGADEDIIQETPLENDPIFYGIIVLLVAIIIALCLLILCCWRYRLWCCCQNKLDKIEQNLEVTSNTRRRVGIGGDTMVKQDVKSQNVTSFYTEKEIKAWNEDDVYKWAITVNNGVLRDVAGILKAHGVNGRTLVSITSNDLIQMAVSFNDRKHFEFARQELLDLAGVDVDKRPKVKGENDDHDFYAGDKDVVPINKQQELVQWLQSKGLGHCATHFMANGYDGLEFIKGITTVQELVDIGIQDQDDQNKVVTFIRELVNTEITLNLNTTIK
eukprot:94176_1